MKRCKIGPWPMSDLPHIPSLGDFLQNHEEHLARLRATRGPELLAIDGRTGIVLQDADAYQALLERLQRLEDFEAVRNGLAQVDAGRTRPADEFFEEFLSRHGIAR